MPDHLRDWWRVREQVPWATAAAPVTGPVGGHPDGVLDHVRTTEMSRDAARATRLLDALREVTDARDLTFDVLAAWQARVLGVPAVGFRTGAAYAKGGRERYGLDPDTRDRFARCLTEATDPLVPLPSRAARVYLDTAFTHPFPDGNARAAMLCLYFVLRRDHVTLALAAPVLSVARRADDLSGTLDLVRLIEVLIAAARKPRDGGSGRHLPWPHGARLGHGDQRP